MGAVSEAAKARQRAGRKELVKMYKDNGICPRCKSWAEPGKVYCAACMRKVIYRQRERDPTGEMRRAYNRERRARLKAAGMCTYCGKKKAVEGHVLCEACKRKNSESQKVYKMRKRLAKAAPTVGGREGFHHKKQREADK